MRKKVQGPLQKNYWNIKHDQTGSLVYPSERHVIKKYRNSQGKIMKINYTDEVRVLNKVWNDFFMEYDILDMQDIITEGKVLKEKRADEFFKRIYEDISYHRVYHHKVDPIYK